MIIKKYVMQTIVHLKKNKEYGVNQNINLNINLKLVNFLCLWIDKILINLKNMIKLNSINMGPNLT